MTGGEEQDSIMAPKSPGYQGSIGPLKYFRTEDFVIWDMLSTRGTDASTDSGGASQTLK
jgi:hypothetical protein